MKRLLLIFVAALFFAPVKSTMATKSEYTDKKHTTTEKVLDLTGKIATTAVLVTLSGLLTYQIYKEELAIQAYWDAYQVAHATAVKLIAEGKLIVPANSMWEDFAKEVIRVGVYEKNILTEHLNSSTFEVLKKGVQVSYTPVLAFFSYLFTGGVLYELGRGIKKTIHEQ